MAVCRENCQTYDWCFGHLFASYCSSCLSFLCHRHRAHHPYDNDRLQLQLHRHLQLHPLSQFLRQYGELDIYHVLAAVQENFNHTTNSALMGATPF